MASCLLSFSINDGTNREVRMLQQILQLPVDGVFGPQTLAATNKPIPQALAAALRNAQANFTRLWPPHTPRSPRTSPGSWRALGACIRASHENLSSAEEKSSNYKKSQYFVRV